MYEQDEQRLESELDVVRRQIHSGEMILRREGDAAVIFGNAHDRYRIFQLRITPLAACLFEMLRDGETRDTIKEAMVQLGEPAGRADEHLANLVAIARFDRTGDTIGYGVITESLSAPLNVTWDITNVCNLTCSYCYNTSGPVIDDSLPIERCVEVADQIADLGVFNVWLGGGEPLMKKGIERVLRRFKERHVKVLLATNGVLLKNDRFLDLIAETCTEVNISIDGHTPELHAMLRGESASLEAAAGGVRRIKERLGDAIYVTGITVVHKGNLEAVPAIIDFCHEIGCNKWTHNELYAMGRGSALRKLVLAHTEYDRLYELASAKADELRGRMVVEDYVRMHKLQDSGRIKPFYGCVAGNQEIAIQHAGDVYPCQKLQYEKYHCGNVKDTSLTAIWKDSPILSWLRSRNIEDTECTGCGAFAGGQCNGGCLAEKEIHFERHDTRDPLCPENRPVYQKVLLDEIPYPYLTEPVREIVPGWGTHGEERSPRRVTALRVVR
ncbi:radical SAM protein [Pendulispora albinea]|uniref:Radical SAM protein n=1 Tax=Pendulispora albinea TaxID=2741071 RepID=A0ABZ2LS21_9BACT